MPFVFNSIPDNLKVEVTYDIANDCGLDSQAIINEEENTLKLGLIAATTTSTIDVLNQTFPRTDDKDRTMRYLRHSNDRNLVQLSPHRWSMQRQRSLVHYADEFPVTIDNVIDVTENCPTGNNCLLIVSTITAILEAGDDPVEVKKAIEDGIRESFTSGTFFGNIPEDTVICPDRRRKLQLRINGRERDNER